MSCVHCSWDHAFKFAALIRPRIPHPTIGQFNATCSIYVVYTWHSSPRFPPPLLVPKKKKKKKFLTPSSPNPNASSSLPSPLHPTQIPNFLSSSYPNSLPLPPQSHHEPLFVLNSPFQRSPPPCSMLYGAWIKLRGGGNGLR